MFPLAHLRSHGRPGSFSPTPATTPRYLRTSLGPDAIHGCAARRCDGRKRGDARCNKFIPPSLFFCVAASYKIKAREASSATRRRLSARQLRAGHGRAREGQLGTMVDTKLLFALLRRRGRSSDQTVSRHRVSYHTFTRLLTFIDLSLTLDPRWNIARSYRDIREECRTRRRDGLLGTSMWTRGTSQYRSLWNSL